MSQELINWLHGLYIETGYNEAQQAADAIQYLLDGADEVNQALWEQIEANERLTAENERLSRPTLSQLRRERIQLMGENEKLKAENATLYTAHDVAVILAEAMGDECACNVNGNDEWLPKKCELLDVCPDTFGVACWEQYLKWRGVKQEDAE